MYMVNNTNTTDNSFLTLVKPRTVVISLKAGFSFCAVNSSLLVILPEVSHSLPWFRPPAVGSVSFVINGQIRN